MNITNKLNPKIAGALRHVLTAGGGYLAASGHVAAADVETLAGAIAIVIGAIWSYIAPEKKG